MNFKNKRVLIAGTGISGIGAANLLLKFDAYVTLYDGNENRNKEEILNRLDTKRNAGIILGDLTKDMIQGIDLMVISPGIPVDAPFTKMIREAGIPIYSEIELAYQCSKGRVVAITGTNGKTTTTALVGEIMKNYYESVFVVGNIGIPYTSVALETKDDSVVVAEISSFQLETIAEFKPTVSGILNITPDHLDRHKTIECYGDTKLKIAMNQTEDQICVLNYDDDTTREMANRIKARPLFFSRKSELEEGIFLKDNAICYKTKTETIKICKLDELKLLGVHNIENIMAAVAMAVSLFVPIEVIAKTIKEFMGVEHRIEYVDTINGVDYYNDSKGTNPDAAIKGIQAMNKPTYLIGGGYDKSTAFDEWIQAFDHKVKLLVLLGATAKEIANTAHKYGFTNIVFADSLEEAVNICAKEAKNGESVLLSPACASWGMFRSYEERGNLFKEYVGNLKG